MKVVLTDGALHDLSDIGDFLATDYPTIAPLVERRLRETIARIARWPESARRAAGRPDVRVVPVGRYPYRIFYRVTRDRVEILHVHHAAREPWDSEP